MHERRLATLLLDYLPRFQCVDGLLQDRPIMRLDERVTAAEPFPRLLLRDILRFERSRLQCPLGGVLLAAVSFIYTARHYFEIQPQGFEKGFSLRTGRCKYQKIPHR